MLFANKGSLNIIKEIPIDPTRIVCIGNNLKGIFLIVQINNVREIMEIDKKKYLTPNKKYVNSLEIKLSLKSIQSASIGLLNPIFAA